MKKLIYLTALICLSCSSYKGVYKHEIKFSLGDVRYYDYSISEIEYLETGQIRYINTNNDTVTLMSDYIIK